MWSTISSLPPHYLYSRFCYVIIIILLIWEFFKPASANGFPQESKWQQISLSFQDSSQYSVWSQQCCSLDGVHSSSNFQVLQPLYQSYGDYTKFTSYNSDHRYFHVSYFF